MSENVFQVVTSIPFDQALLAIRKHVDEVNLKELDMSDAELLDECAEVIRSRLETLNSRTEEPVPMLSEGQRQVDSYAKPEALRKPGMSSIMARISKLRKEHEQGPRQVFARICTSLGNRINDEGVSFSTLKNMVNYIKRGEATSAKLLSGLGYDPNAFSEQEHLRVHVCLCELYRELR